MTAQGNNLVDANGNVVAVFTNPEDAIAYLRALGCEETEE